MIHRVSTGCIVFRTVFLHHRWLQIRVKCPRCAWDMGGLLRCSGGGRPALRDAAPCCWLTCERRVARSWRRRYINWKRNKRSYNRQGIKSLFSGDRIVADSGRGIRSEVCRFCRCQDIQVPLGIFTAFRYTYPNPLHNSSAWKMKVRSSVARSQRH